MAPKVNRCWMCGRTTEEVRSSVGRPPEEVQLDNRLERMEEIHAKFSRASGEWGSLVSDQFRSLDFEFVVGNPGQFKAMRFLGEVDDAKKSIVMPLQVAIGNVRNGIEASIGGVKIGPLDESRKRVLLKETEEFERRNGRRLDGSGTNGGTPRGFDGLSIGQGLAFLKEVGALYFDIQEKLLEAEKEDEMRRGPVFAISNARVGELLEVPVCTVCQNLVTSAISA